jgi:hypothetical protein
VLLPEAGGKWREGESSPYTGKLSARPAGKPSEFFITEESLRRSLSRHFLASAPQHAFFEGMAESFWSDEVFKAKPNPGVGTDRLPMVGPKPR